MIAVFVFWEEAAYFWGGSFYPSNTLHRTLPLSVRMNGVCLYLSGTPMEFIFPLGIKEKKQQDSVTRNVSLIVSWS